MRSALRVLFELLLLLVAVLALALVGLPGPLYRFGAIGLGTAFTMIEDGAWLGIATGVLALIGLLGAGIVRERRLALLGAFALLAAAVSFGIPYSWLEKARAVPPIHDITTDPGHPPAFRAILRTHPVLVNSPIYGGGPKEEAAQELLAVRGYLEAQARGHGPKARAAEHLLTVCRRWDPACLGGVTRVFYPRVRPLVVRGLSPGRVLETARRLMRARGWTLVPTRRPDRLEAVARTAWFGFRDDVALRVTSLGPKQVRVDMRSESRLGLSDIGRNAARVTSFLHALARRLGHGRTQR
jgi:uncharacterized protein (DUF1499 family)